MAFFQKMWLPIWSLAHSGQLNHMFIVYNNKCMDDRNVLGHSFHAGSPPTPSANISIPTILWNHPSWLAFGLISPPHSSPSLSLPLSLILTSFFTTLLPFLHDTSEVSLFFPPASPSALRLAGSSFPDQGLNPGPRQWERWVLTTGPPKDSWLLAFQSVVFQTNTIHHSSLIPLLIQSSSRHVYKDKTIKMDSHLSKDPRERISASSSGAPADYLSFNNNPIANDWLSEEESTFLKHATFMTARDASGIGDHMDNIKEKSSSGSRGPIICCFIKLNNYPRSLAFTVQVSLWRSTDTTSKSI